MSQAGYVICQRHLINDSYVPLQSITVVKHARGSAIAEGPRDAPRTQLMLFC